jgi:hypothetical protein
VAQAKLHTSLHARQSVSQSRQPQQTNPPHTPRCDTQHPLPAQELSPPPKTLNMASSPPPDSGGSSSPFAPSTNPPTHARDHLTTIPHEIIQNIASCLYASHIPDRELHQIDSHYSGIPYKQSQIRDLANLSRTSKLLYQQTNAWAHLFLHSHRDITKYRVFKTPKAAANQQPALQKLLQWSVRHCVFCGKTSQREAILMNGLHCCRGCDREQWPDKITETQASKEFGLTKQRDVVLQGSTTVLGQRQAQRLKLRYGTYFCMGVCTTMYLRKDVEAYVEALQEGGWDPVVEKRARKRERRAALKEMRNLPIVIEDDDDDDDDDGDGDAVEVSEGGVKSGAVFQEPIIIDDD